MNARTISAGSWRVTLQPPVLVYGGNRDEHITRPNLCVLNGAVAAIFQTTFDTSATPRDCKDIWVSTTGGASWRRTARQVDIGSYALHSKPNGEVVVLPYDSLRYGATKATLTGPRTTLAWVDGALRITADTTTANFPEPLKGFLAEPIRDPAGKPLYLEDDLPPTDKPITSFWGTVQELHDCSRERQRADGSQNPLAGARGYNSPAARRWIVPMYGCYESEPFARTSRAPEMRRMARFTTELFVSADEGRSWLWHSRIATPRDVPAECVEGPSEVHLFQFPDRWRAVFRTSALKKFFQPLHYAETTAAGMSWTKPQPLPNVTMLMDPRGLQLPGGITVLSAGRPKIDLYLADGASLDFHALDLTAHHNAYLPRLRTTGHTDVVALGPRSLLFTYDYIPDSWRWPGSPFTAPDAIYTVRIDIE